MPAAPPDARPPQPDPGRVEAVPGNSTVTLLVRGRLDGAAGAALLDAARAELATGIARLDVDLRAVDGFDEVGADALVTVRELGAGLSDGVHYRTTAGAGGDALLVAFAGRGADETAP